MFRNTLDNKKTFVREDGIEAYDLSEGIFGRNGRTPRIGSVFRVQSDYNMRPDLISKAFYGSTDYTEMLMKYSLIDNPFSVIKDDVVYQASLDVIYYPVAEEIAVETDMSDFIRNRHKYIDKTKVPTSPGSEKATTSIPDTPMEANLSKNNDSGVTVSNGKIYFGNMKKSTDSPVECATDGTTVGEFINALTKQK